MHSHRVPHALSPCAACTLTVCRMHSHRVPHVLSPCAARAPWLRCSWPCQLRTCPAEPQSDVRLLKLYESGLPAWAVFLPSYGERPVARAHAAFESRSPWREAQAANKRQHSPLCLSLWVRLLVCLPVCCGSRVRLLAGHAGFPIPAAPSTPLLHPFPSTPDPSTQHPLPRTSPPLPGRCIPSLPAALEGAPRFIACKPAVLCPWGLSKRQGNRWRGHGQGRGGGAGWRLVRARQAPTSPLPSSSRQPGALHVPSSCGAPGPWGFELPSQPLLEQGLPACLPACGLAGLWYRPWMRKLTWFLFMAVSVMSMAMGFYDLYKNVPIVRQVGVGCVFRSVCMCVFMGAVLRPNPWPWDSVASTKACSLCAMAGRDRARGSVLMLTSYFYP